MILNNIFPDTARQMADKTPEGKTPEDKTPEKSGHWDKNLELIFRGRTEPPSYKNSK